MFNFEDLDIQRDTNDIYNSFVGIRENIETNRMTFYLPKGFEELEVDYDNIKKLFFSMYKTFKRFEIDNASYFDKMLDKEGRNRDNTSSRDSKGYSFSNEEGDNELLFYSKIDIIDNFFKIHKDLDIDSIVQKFGYTENIDYSNIEILLNEGVFLKNNAIFVSNNTSEKNVIESSISGLVELYCYIYKELLIELGNEISPIISEVANNFSYKYLTSLQSLFDKDTYELTILVLKDRLDIIDRNTAYKDCLYYDIHEVIEQFLYGQLSSNDNNGHFWGINNFSYIWEDMCNSFVLSDSSRKIIYCDSSLKVDNILSIHKNLQRTRFGGHSVYIDKDFTNNFSIELDGHKRWMRPDIIFTNKDSSSVLDTLSKNKLLSFKIDRLTNKSSDLVEKINIAIKFEKNHDSSDTEILLAKKIFEYFKDSFSELKYIGNYLYIKSRGHKLKIINSSFIELSNISKEVVDDIYKKAEEKGRDDNVYIVDWKYVPSSFFNKNTEKLKVDIIKQLTYEFCIRQSQEINNELISQFCIPKYCNSNNLVIEENQLPIADTNIQIINLNFGLIQKEYITKEIGVS